MNVTAAIIIALSGGLGGVGAAGIAFSLVTNSQNKKIKDLGDDVKGKVDCVFCDLQHKQIENRLKAGDLKFNKLVEKIETATKEHAETNKQLAVVVERLSNIKEEKERSDG